MNSEVRIWVGEYDVYESGVVITPENKVKYWR